MGISGILGILIVKEDKIGLAGELPELIRHGDPRILEKISRDALSGGLSSDHVFVTGADDSFFSVTEQPDREEQK